MEFANYNDWYCARQIRCTVTTGLVFRYYYKICGLIFNIKILKAINPRNKAIRHGIITKLDTVDFTII